MSPFRRFERAVCPPPKASRQPAGPFARLHSPSRDLWLHMPAPQPCLSKAGARHSLGVSKAPFARPQKPLGSRQGRWPGSTALPGTFGCTCLHRSLACQSRCMSLFRRFESAVCPPPKASGSTALPGTFGCTCLHRSLACHSRCTAALPAKAGACHSLGVCQSRCMSLFRRFESAVCPPLHMPAPQPAGPFATLHSPSRDLWLHMPAPQPCLPKPVHVTL